MLMEVEAYRTHIHVGKRLALFLVYLKTPTLKCTILRTDATKYITLCVR